MPGSVRDIEMQRTALRELRRLFDDPRVRELVTRLERPAAEVVAHGDSRGRRHR